MKRRLNYFILVVILLTMLTGCTGSSAVANADFESENEAKIEIEAQEKEDVKAVIKTEQKVETIEPIQVTPQPIDYKNSVWVVYWDYEYTIEEIRFLYDDIDNIYHFAAYFDSDNDLFIDENTSSLFKNIDTEFPDSEWENYITIVNDKINDDNSSSLKDTEMLYELLSDENSSKHHINQIVDLAKENNFDGIIIDYENIDDDMQLWDLFEKFCDLLYEECENNDLKLRIVFEPSAPIDDLSFKKDIGSIMMCYNLYGYHSEPGPKANAEFILAMTQKMKNVEGYKEYAISTGGFDWSENRTIGLTQFDAQLLAEEYEVEYMRDDDSRGVYFSYEDEDSVDHEVWYADSETLNYWINLIRDNDGSNISIWRLSGLDAKKISEFVSE